MGRAALLFWDLSRKTVALFLQFLFIILKSRGRDEAQSFSFRTRRSPESARPSMERRSVRGSATVIRVRHNVTVHFVAFLGWGGLLELNLLCSARPQLFWTIRLVFGCA